MVGYNFQPRFIEPIQNRIKRQTCRRVGARRHARPGEKIQLYVGIRTKNCRKILTEDPTCILVQPAIIDLAQPGKPIVEVGGKLVKGRDLELFVERDGFSSIADFVMTFVEIYSEFEDEMVLIVWGF